MITATQRLNGIRPLTMTTIEEIQGLKKVERRLFLAEIKDLDEVISFSQQLYEP